MTATAAQFLSVPGTKLPGSLPAVPLVYVSLVQALVLVVRRETV